MSLSKCAVHCIVFTKLTLAQRRCMEVLYREFYPRSDEKLKKRSMVEMSVTPLSKIRSTVAIFTKLVFTRQMF
jgi:hypothetical protein